MKLGFVGTIDGCKVHAWLNLCDWMKMNSADGGISEVHHGGSNGADAEFQVAVIRNRIGRVEGRQWADIHIHPSDDAVTTDFDLETAAHKIHIGKPVAIRNQNVVDACDILLVCPEGQEVQGSPVWKAVRYARSIGRRVVVFYPGGNVEEDKA